MRLSAPLVLITAVTLLLVGASRAAQASDGLIAHGSPERFWIARGEISSTDGQKLQQTTFFLRGPGDSALQRFGRIDGRAVLLAHRGTQLAALLASGDWILGSDSGASTEGPALPGSARMIALVGSDDSFRALGLTDMNASTQPSNARAVWTYFELENGKWKAVVDLPIDVLAAKSAPSIAIIDRIPTVAFLADDRTARLLHFDGSVWNGAQSIDLTSPAVSCQLLRGTETTVLWVQREKNADSLEFVSSGNTPHHVPLSFIPASAPDVSVALALGQIRVLWSIDGAVHEQDLDPANGALVGSPATVELPSEVPYLNIARGIEYVIWSALFFAILGAMRWRRVMQGMVFDLDKIHLAPLGRRFSAGVIDLFPIIIALAVLKTSNLSPRTAEITGLCGCGLYLLHTGIAEILTARSLGKWLLGLYVVALDGERPLRSSLLIRNLLRVIDLGLGLMPLIVVLVSPLRQRTGDVAAGTLVVRTTPTS